MYSLPLSEKIKILFIVKLKQLGILKLIKVSKRIALNEYSRELLKEADVRIITGLFGGEVRYQLAVDPTGEYRIYLPGLDSEAVYRVDERYSLKEVDCFHSDDLMMIILKEGRRENGR